jgi:hypothetical protein
MSLEVQFPGVVAPGDTNVLRISALQTGVPSPDDALAGVHLDLTVTGGTVGHFSGETDEDGLFQTTGRMFDNQPALTIEIVARTRDGGPVLARRTVHALPLADAELLGVWSGSSDCADPPIPLVVRITRGGTPGSPPLELSITQAGSNTGAIRQEFFGLVRQPDGTYLGTSALPELSTAALTLTRLEPGVLRGVVTGGLGSCGGGNYQFVAHFVSN